MIDSKLIILFVVCVIFMVYLGVEGFAAYTSYSQMLAAKYGTLNSKTGSSQSDAELTAKYQAMNLSGSELANAVKAAKEWQSYNANPSNDLYKTLAGGQTTMEDIKKTIGKGDKGKMQDKKWLTYYDATNYDPDSPDIIKTASGSYLQKRTGSRLNETSYIDTVYFNEDTQKAGGRTLVQCKSDDFNCIRNLTYSDPNYQPYQGDSSWQTQFGGGLQTNNAGFPTTTTLPPMPTPASAAPSGGAQASIDQKITTVTECIAKCLSEPGSVINEEKLRACAAHCASKIAA